MPDSFFAQAEFRWARNAFIIIREILLGMPINDGVSIMEKPARLKPA